MPSEVREGQCRHLVPLYVPMAVTKTRALQPLCWPSRAGRSPQGLNLSQAGWAVKGQRKLLALQQHPADLDPQSH